MEMQSPRYILIAYIDRNDAMNMVSISPNCEGLDWKGI